MLQTLQLKQYRSHTDLSLTFSPQTNVIIGLNGSGKTNILEAILVGYIGKSYRAKDIYLVQHTTNQARITLQGDDFKRQVRFDVSLATKKIDKSFTINQKKQKRLSFSQTIPVVLFEPEFMQIIARGPEARREYIDAMMSHTLQGYQTQLNTYKRVLSQRNALLKRSPSSDDLFVWDVKLSQVGGIIASRRHQLIDKINEKLSDIYSQLSDREYKVSLRYLSLYTQDNYSEQLLSALQKNITTDSERGFTTTGPHREDIGFSINNEEVSLTASRGETRTLLLALKIFEMQFVEVLRGMKPLLLLDDVFSELDEVRQTKLIEYFKDNQVIITTTNITPLMKGISGKVIELS